MGSGMTPFQLDIYLSEVEVQCDFCIAAAEAVNTRLAEIQQLPSSDISARMPGLQAELFRSIHSFLTHAAGVSRLLWPTPPRKRRGEAPATHRRRRSHSETRGRELRNVLGVLNEEIGARRTLRDHLEHFDERIDNWVLTSDRHNFVDRCVGPSGSIVGAEPEDVMRWFDPTTGRFSLRGTSFDLGALATWVSDLRSRTGRARKDVGATSPAAQQAVEPDVE